MSEQGWTGVCLEACTREEHVVCDGAGQDSFDSHRPRKEGVHRRRESSIRKACCSSWHDLGMHACMCVSGHRRGVPIRCTHDRGRLLVDGNSELGIASHDARTRGTVALHTGHVFSGGAGTSDGGRGWASHRRCPSPRLSARVLWAVSMASRIPSIDVGRALVCHSSRVPSRRSRRVDPSLAPPPAVT